MSIGLMVDYVIHVALRYVETKGDTRTQKTEVTLQTIGSSVLIGGISTLIGVLPLAFSTSEIFWTTFIVFFGLVILGLLHGLVLLPVLLSMVGPLESVSGYWEHEPQLDADKSASTAPEVTQTGNVPINMEIDDLSVRSTESIEV
jgi:multidrug efflux pump subunit AcrB